MAGQSVSMFHCRIYQFLFITSLCAVLFGVALQSAAPAAAASKHLHYYGFTLVDVGYDDPLDQEAKTNYLNEVAAFTNVADILVVKPENIISRIDAMLVKSVRPYIHVYPLFFEQTGSKAPSGNAFSLRKDYREQWSLFVSRNKLKARQADIAAFYLGEEPTWNGISASDLKTASDHIKATVPKVPILIVEGYPRINELVVPESADWVGFDRYFLKAPAQDKDYLAQFALLKTKLSSPKQKLVVIMDAHYRPEAHGTYGLTEADMTEIAMSYFKLAESDPRVIGLFGYTWAGGFDGGDTKGARQLLPQTRHAYRMIGKFITGKGYN